MNSKDTLGLMAMLETAYPTFYAKQTDRQRQEAARLWAHMFQDDPRELVIAAAKAIIAGSERQFPPSIGEVKARMLELAGPQELTEAEAWALVSKACANGLYGAEKEFQKLPPEIQAAVGAPEQLKAWARMDAETVESVVASNFMRTWKTLARRRRDQALLPESVRAALEGIVRPALTEGGSGDG